MAPDCRSLPSAPSTSTWSWSNVRPYEWISSVSSEITVIIVNFRMKKITKRRNSEPFCWPTHVHALYKTKNWLLWGSAHWQAYYSCSRNHGPFSRAVNLACEHGYHFGHPCWRAVFTDAWPYCPWTQIVKIFDLGLKFPPDRREKCIIAMSVWLYVCLSARIFQKPHVQTTPHFRCIWPLAVIRSYSGDVLLCTSGFVDNVMFARNTRRATRSGRVLKLTHQAAAPVRSLMYTIAMFSKTKLNMHLRSLLSSNEIRYC